MKLLLIILLMSFELNAQESRYWTGAGLSNTIDNPNNWLSLEKPNLGDNLVFNNTSGENHSIYSNYGNGSIFSAIITYNGSGLFKWLGDVTFLDKIENNNSTNSLDIDSYIHNRSNSNLEINPKGSGGINFLSNSKLTIQDSKLLTVFGSSTLTFNSVIDELNGSGRLLLSTDNPKVILNRSCSYSGLTIVSGGILQLNALGGAVKSGNAVTINGGILRVMQSQTIGNLILSSGSLQVDPGVILTITGTYSASGGTINNLGTIKFAGGSVVFPGQAIINNGSANTLTNIEVASLATLILNVSIKIAGILSIDSGAIFDNGGENQILNGSNGSIKISGTFITRDIHGFVGTNTAIPSIIPSLEIGSTVEYGLNGNQNVQGITAPIYQNITFSNGGIKTLISKNNVLGTITISGSTIFDAENNNFGSPSSKVIMTETSKYKLGGTIASKPESGGTYSLGPKTTIEFTGTSATNIRLISPIINYANIIISGSNVSNPGSSTGIKFQTGATFIVKTGAIFKLSNTAGFNGAINTAINNTNSPTIILETDSTIEYTGMNQFITNAEYSNLTISGTGTKTIPGTSEILVKNELKVKSATLQIDSNKLLTVTNSINNSSGNNIVINDSGNLVQLTEVDNLSTNSNIGNIKMNRISRSLIINDYVYWGSPVKENVLPQIPNTFDRTYIWDLNGSINGNWRAPSTIMPGQGFITRAKKAGHSSFDFVGTPNNGTVKIWANGYDAVSDVYGNYTLLSNPYPSAIDATAFVTNFANSGLSGTLYFWTSSTPFSGAEYNSNDYSSWNLTGGTSTAPAISNPILSLKPTGNIAAGQGFFAAIESDFDVTFTNAMRIRSGMDNSQFFKTNGLSKKQTEKNRIWLNLSGPNYAFKQILVGYVSGATNDMDRLFDGTVFSGNEVNFYSILKDKSLTIQGRSLPFNFDDKVPLGFLISNAGEYKIDIDEMDGFFKNLDVPIYLEDKLLNLIHDLKKEAYSFSSEKGNFNDRFVVHYTNVTLEKANFIKAKPQIIIFNINKQIRINSKEDKISGIMIFNLLGKQIYIKKNIDNNEFLIPNLVLSEQVLLLKIILQNGEIRNEKIIF